MRKNTDDKFDIPDRKDIMIYKTPEETYGSRILYEEKGFLRRSH